MSRSTGFAQKCELLTSRGSSILVEIKWKSQRSPKPISSFRRARLLGLRVCDRNDGSNMPAVGIVNERLDDQKFVVL